MRANDSHGATDLGHSDLDDFDLYENEKFIDFKIDQVTKNNKNCLVQILDPCENYNRRIYRFNYQLDRAVFKPAAGLYRATFSSQWLRNRFNNFFNNLDEPLFMMNSLFQGNMKNFFISSFRFLVNSTLGIGGMFDILKSKGIESEKLTFATTLQRVLKAPRGDYIFLPVIGPSDYRTMVGTFCDIVLNPIDFAIPSKRVSQKLIARAIAKREQLWDSINELERTSIDPYSVVRSAYIQSCQNNRSKH